MSTIYTINFLNKNIFYVGSAVNFKKRKYQHLSNLRNNIHHSSKLQNAFNKYGEINIRFEIFEDDICEKDLLSWEQAAFEIFPNKYNICEFAGNTLGIKFSEETRRKMSNSQKGKHVGILNPMYGKNGILNPMYSKSHSLDSKIKISLANTLTHCRRGHEYTIQNTYFSTRKNGSKSRSCRFCKLEKMNENFST